MITFRYYYGGWLGEYSDLEVEWMIEPYGIIHEKGVETIISCYDEVHSLTVL